MNRYHPHRHSRQTRPVQPVPQTLELAYARHSGVGAANWPWPSLHHECIAAIHRQDVKDELRGGKLAARESDRGGDCRRAAERAVSDGEGAADRALCFRAVRACRILDHYVAADGLGIEVQRCNHVHAPARPRIGIQVDERVMERGKETAGTSRRHRGDGEGI